MRRFIRPRATGRRGDSWQVIYMDLMTIIMVFFVILWSISQREDAGVSETTGDQTVKLITLPGDVLFSSGRSTMTKNGEGVFHRLFSDETGAVLNFDTGGMVKRLLVVHGHTDGDGPKEDNFELGYRRAFTAYKEIQKYGEDVPEHVILCSHADNSPDQEVPVFQGDMTPAEASAIWDAKSQNRRIAIEDKIVSRGASTQ